MLRTTNKLANHITDLLDYKFKYSVQVLLLKDINYNVDVYGNYNDVLHRINDAAHPLKL